MCMKSPRRRKRAMDPPELKLQMSVMNSRLCLCYGDEEDDEELPRPSISAWPSSEVKPKSNVTLRCRTHFQNVTVTLGKLHNSGYQRELRSAGKEAEFHLTNLQPEDAGGYFCAYRTAASPRWSAKSQHLQLVVTDGVGGGGEIPPRSSNSKPIILTTLSCLSISLLFVSIYFIYRCTQQAWPDTKKEIHEKCTLGAGDMP
ncbi:V-set and transmembrane domain-containing protein 1 isoform X2 [Cricetulus griseus]|uniref:V-set and transmembrane domain-containing protein 1 isoform X2 n=1 Tax=Cricetulus griseus TaxID=10029 RepID=A0A9J7H7B1_CRIGR|nr:V-set and transmembrane domain-containing protein 1 isoform X2 [Cricetulus griseus]